VALNPFVSLRTRLTAQEDVPMFRARSTQRERWRLMVYDRFDGTDFAPSSDPRSNLVDFEGPLAGDQDPDLPVTQVTQEVEIQELGSFWLPAATTPVRVDAGRRVLANQTFASLTINQRLRQGFHYTVVSQVPTSTRPTWSARSTTGTTPACGRTWRPAAWTGRCGSRAEAVVAAKDADTPFDKALAIQDYLRSKEFRYNLNVPSLAAGGNQLRRFLTEVREGYCEQFAIAMAMMARQVGVPSRVAVGFTSGEIIDNTFSRSPPTTPTPGRSCGSPRPAGCRSSRHRGPTARCRCPPTPPPPAGCQPTRQGQPAQTQTTPGTTANTPSVRPTPRRVDNSDPLAGAGTDQGWLARPVVRAGLAVATAGRARPRGQVGPQPAARRRAGHRPRDAVAESYAS
jgi:hypothetical protein